jgi:hypothetical protein
MSLRDGVHIIECPSCSQPVCSVDGTISHHVFIGKGPVTFAFPPNGPIHSPFAGEEQPVDLCYGSGL